MYEKKLFSLISTRCGHWTDETCIYLYGSVVSLCLHFCLFVDC